MKTIRGETKLQALEAVAALLAEGGELHGRIRLQKSLFLLQWAGWNELSELSFSYDSYGPYALDVADALRQGVDAELFTQKTESFEEEWQLYSYALSPKGKRNFASVELSHRTKIKKVVGLLQSNHWRTLELAATVAFLEDATHIARARAESRAVALQPACRPFVKSARLLLGALRQL